MELTGITYAAAKSHVRKLIDLRMLSEEPFQFKGVNYYVAEELINTAEGPLQE
jgi:hypothetical protein